MFETIKAEADKKREWDNNIVNDYKNGSTLEEISYKYSITRQAVKRVVNWNSNNGKS